jgi:hypothetical protein
MLPVPVFNHREERAKRGPPLFADPNDRFFTRPPVPIVAMMSVRVPGMRMGVVDA